METRSVHFIGIGGVGMAALAVLLKRRGMRVSGCDGHQSHRLKWLSSQGIEVSCGHSPDHASHDMAVVTPAVSSSEPEVQAFSGRIRKRGEVLAEVVGSSGDSIAVCGSHGKTTTSTWIAKTLIALGENVEWAIGGETGDFPVAGFIEADASKKSSVLVVEADESDGTLALYKAKTLVVTNCEYDHPDHFSTQEEYFACYDAARRAAENVIESEDLPEEAYLSSLMSLLDPHNRKNARAAVEVALRRGHAIERIAIALKSAVAELPDRRFEKIVDGVWTDYAHHPTEISCAIQMARAKCTGKLIVLFQPHRYSRTKAFVEDFARVLSSADEVLLCPTYSAFEKPLEGGDVADIYSFMRSAALTKSYLAPSCLHAWEHARNSYKSGDVILLLGAGDIVNLVPVVRSDASKGFSSARVLRKNVIGDGVNTWRSELNTDDVYERVDFPAGVSGLKVLAERPRLMPWMAGIPGTVGGWVKMNAGAFGHSVSEAIEKVKIDGKWVDSSECSFGYRTSSIKGIIEDIRWKNEDDMPTEDIHDASWYLAKRKRFPAGTYGSFFKNPPGDFAGRILEEVGAKEMRVGGAYVWEEHANVIVRGKDATSSDVLALARLMQLRVLTKTGIVLQPEVCGIAPALIVG
jgi:UDP-N-acetylmuramate--alanine ligase